MDYFSGWCKSERRLENITAIVTGGNAGIGTETVLDFYKRGARVIMACRDMGKAEATKRKIEESSTEETGTLIIENLDLSSIKSVRKFVNKVLVSETSVNILVNNAGVMCCPESRTEDGFEMHLGTNHLGHAMLTLLLLPKMIESGPSRIVFVTSDIHYFSKIDLVDINYETTPYSPVKAYCWSKSAMIMFAKALSLQLMTHNVTNVTTYSVHPGIVYTDIDQHLRGTWFWASYIFRMPWLRWMWKTPKCGAQTTIYCAVDEKCANESGLYYRDCSPTSPSWSCQRKQDICKLWDITLKMLKLQNYVVFLREK